MQGNRMKIINIKNTVKFPLTVFLKSVTRDRPCGPPWLLSLKIGQNLWTITREQCISKSITILSTELNVKPFKIHKGSVHKIRTQFFEIFDPPSPLRNTKLYKPPYFYKGS